MLAKTETSTLTVRTESKAVQFVGVTVDVKSDMGETQANAMVEVARERYAKPALYREAVSGARVVLTAVMVIGWAVLLVLDVLPEAAINPTAGVVVVIAAALAGPDALRELRELR